MPRDSGGTYTLPAGNPVVSGTIVASSWANATMDDMAIAMTDSLSRSGNGAMQAALKLIDGSESGPSLTFNNDPLTGHYLNAVGEEIVTVLGVDQVRFSNTGLSVTDGEGGWVPVLGTGGAIVVTTDFTDVQGETVFETAEANSAAEVRVNGVALATTDYTFTLGNTVTLEEAVRSADDIVQVLGYGSFDISDPAGAREQLDVYSKAETDNGRKNYLINGDMSVWQRGTVFNGVNGFTADRWRYTNANHDGAQSTDVPNGATYSYSETAINGALPNLRTGIELVATGRAGVFHIGSTFTLSVMVKGDPQDLSANLSFRDTINVATNQVEVVGNTVMGAVTAEWTKVTLTFTVNAAPVGTNQSLSLAFIGSLNDGNILFSQVQLESGTVATPFEYQRPDEILAACQRYYQSVASEINCSPIFNSVSDLSRRGNVLNPVTMRGTPDYVITGSGGAWATGPATRQVTADGFAISGTASTDVSFTTVTTWTADAEL